jgi:nicotinate-nucleotide adenylyltransferase
MKPVALFGGSFNPPHVAHQLVALYILETQPVDELWFVPTYAHPFGKPLAAYEHRLAMCELAAAPLGARVRVSRAEEELANAPGFVSSRTFDLVAHIAAQGVAPRLAIGTDILHETHKWYRWDELVAKAPLIIVGRTGHAGSVVTGVTMPEISSTRIRELLVANDQHELPGLLPRSVLGYIAQHRLYRA